MTKIKKIGVLTSGGDAPGMNAAIRAIVLSALRSGIKTVGIKRGYTGLIQGDVMDLSESAVNYIAEKGGTILLTARCAEMRTPEGQQVAAEVCRRNKLDGLIVIGGDGSITGASKLSALGINTIGVPATIDLDLPITKYTIGFDTAVNTVLEAIAKIRDTSSSHERCSVVEVMGRHSGWIALWSAIGAGAEQALIPEFNEEVSFPNIIKRLKACHEKGKKDHLIVMGEGLVKTLGNAYELAKKIEAETGIETRGTILGHLQRGGTPSAVDRMHSTRMGIKAVELLKEGKTNRIVIFDNGGYGDIDIVEGLSQPSYGDQTLFQTFHNLTL